VVAKHYKTDGTTEMAACTSILKSHLQMYVNGEWVTQIQPAQTWTQEMANTASINNNLSSTKLGQLDIFAWLKSTSSTSTGTLSFVAV